MTKQEFLTKVQSKVGFHSIIADAKAPDNIAEDPIQKHYLYVNTANADGTMGKTFVYYLQDTATNEVSFYNVEAEVLDAKVPTQEQTKLNALSAYLKSTFNAYFVIRHDLINNWAEADTYSLDAGKLAYKKVLVFKQGANPVSHLEII